MFENIVEQLKLMLLNYGLKYSKINDRLICFDSKKYNFAFDVVSHENFISIDFVYRRGTINKTFILKKYPNLDKNKCRILTLLESSSVNIFYEFIKNEYLELIYYYDKLNNIKLYSVDNNKRLILEEPLSFWFADGIPNFGDFMTPWLANYFTNRPILNVRNIPSSEGAILGVGSIVQAYGPNHKKVKVWGSGIISAENHISVANKLKKAKLDYVYACRGELTKKFFKKFEFPCSNILGDPGLLFGNIYSPQIIKKYKYVIVPHYIHYNFFKDLNIDDCLIVDVRNELTTVIDQICSAEKCISTSMHGLIIAQTYSIPWLHLYIKDGRLLMGEDFKFQDFFSILNIKKVSQEKALISYVNKDFILKLFEKVSLPSFQSNYSEEALIESFYNCLEDKKL